MVKTQYLAFSHHVHSEEFIFCCATHQSLADIVTLKNLLNYVLQAGIMTLIEFVFEKRLIIKEISYY